MGSTPQGQYTPRVRPDLFDDRLMGQAKEQVLAVHGEPLGSYISPGGDEVWVYSDNKATSSLYWWLELRFDGKTQRVCWFVNRWYSD